MVRTVVDLPLSIDDKNKRLIEDKNRRLLSTVPHSVLLKGLASTIEVADNIVLFGETPGSKRFVGAHDGDRFSMMKKTEVLNPFARKLFGRIIVEGDGTFVEYRFRHRPLAKIVVVFFLLAFLSHIFVDFAIFLVVTRALNPLDPVTLVMLALNFLILIAISTILFLKVDGILAFKTEEELLDCIKRIASGATPMVD